MSQVEGTSSEGPLWAISPVDGRYAAAVGELRPLVSEGALIAYRIKVECAWLSYLGELAEQGVFGRSWRLQAFEQQCLEGLMQPDAVTRLVTRVKEHEAQVRHDVKAVEYLLREELQAVGANPATLALIHFACTSEDINNLAYALMLKDLTHQVVVPSLQKSIRCLAEMSATYAAVPMLAHTHGQAATPTTVGKELAVFGHRLAQQCAQIRAQTFYGKLNGAVGNYNAHYAVAPELDWPQLSRQFIEHKLKLTWNAWTTQIENHDFIAEYCAKLRLSNTIGVDLVRDLWTYVSFGYFKQRIKAEEVGSSIMPHKVNPIDFENAEGNFGMSSALADHFANKLPISRLQRDLSDSTVLRNLGVMVAYHILAHDNLRRGLAKLEVNAEALQRDLDGAWEVLAEPLQTILRAAGVVDAYELVKARTRGKQMTEEGFHRLVQELAAHLPADLAANLAGLSPHTYVGAAPALARAFASMHR